MEMINMVDIHKHCPVCGTPIPLSETTCSDKCQTVLNERAQKMRKARLINFAFLAAIIVIVVLLVIVRGNFSF